MFIDVIVSCIILAMSGPCGCSNDRSFVNECRGYDPSFPFPTDITQIWALEFWHLVHCMHLQPPTTLCRLSDKVFGSPALNQGSLLLKDNVYTMKFTLLDLAMWSQPHFLVFYAMLHFILVFYSTVLPPSHTVHYPGFSAPLYLEKSFKTHFSGAFCPSTVKVI